MGDESVSKDEIEHVFITGGALQLQSTHGKNKKLSSQLRESIKSQLEREYKKTAVGVSYDPQLSILSGAKTLFMLPDFDKKQAVTKQEWQEDNQSIIKKLF